MLKIQSQFIIRPFISRSNWLYIITIIHFCLSLNNYYVFAVIIILLVTNFQTCEQWPAIREKKYEHYSVLILIWSVIYIYQQMYAKEQLFNCLFYQQISPTHFIVVHIVDWIHRWSLTLIYVYLMMMKIKCLLKIWIKLCFIQKTLLPRWRFYHRT